MAIHTEHLDDVEVIQAVFAAFAERDVEGVLRHSDPDIVFSPQTADYAGRTEPYHGHDGLREYFRDVASVWDELRLTPGEFRQSGETILVTGRVNARSPARVIDGSTGWIWELRDHRVVYCRVYPSATDAITAFEPGDA
jgi:ketosteroid isomerase-like protein